MDPAKAALQSALGRAVKKYREVELKLTQEELANSSGLNQNWISHIENGYNALNLWNLRRLSAALGLTMSELLTRAEKEEQRGGE